MNAPSSTIPATTRSGPRAVEELPPAAGSRRSSSSASAAVRPLAEHVPDVADRPHGPDDAVGAPRGRPRAGVDPHREAADAVDVEPCARAGVQVLLPPADEHRLAPSAAHPPAAVLRRVTTSDGKRDAATQDGGSAAPVELLAHDRVGGRGGLDVAGEHRPAVLPDDLVGEGLPAEHVPLRARAAGRTPW